MKGAAVYFSRFIIHDWADEESIKIMKRLREAASPTSKLILFETLVPYACHDPMEYAGTVERRSAPWPVYSSTREA